MLTLILVRHAATGANEQKCFSGFNETPISEKGKKEIEGLTKTLVNYEIDAIYASPSTRALKTAEPIANQKSKTIQTAEELREIHFGDFEGMNFDAIDKAFPHEITKMIEQGDDYCYPNGESLVQSYKRTASKIDEIKIRHSGQTILICAHAGTIRNILTHLISKSHKLHWHFKIDNASLTLVTIENDFAVIERLNDTHFLQNMI